MAPEKVSASKEIVEEEMFRLELGKWGVLVTYQVRCWELKQQRRIQKQSGILWNCDVINKLPPMAIYFMVCKKYHSLCCPDEGAFFKNHREICSKNWNCLIYIASSKQLVLFLLPHIWGGVSPGIDLINQPGTVNCITLGLLGFFVPLPFSCFLAMAVNYRKNLIPRYKGACDMAIILRLDRVMADQKISLNELADRVGITNVNLSNLKTGKVKAIRFTTLNAICRELSCQPGDILEYEEDAEE